jgi:molybdopterin synthase sulfur carrier subunit
LIKVVLFASLREDLGVGEVEVAATGVCSVADLIEGLSQRFGEVWRETLVSENVLVAINQNMVKNEISVSDGDEVAFFPPVTGG